jgi:rhodanese-related sulfurtransferase
MSAAPIRNVTVSAHASANDAADTEGADIGRILDVARERGVAAGVRYAGLLTPREAYRLVREADAVLVDVRSRAEWELVGRPPGSALVEWRSYPCRDANPRFLEELAGHAGQGDLVLFLCRSGQRSNEAAEAAAAAGYGRAYNILEGFEGERDASGRRGNLGGWRKVGLPWVQS